MFGSLTCQHHAELSPLLSADLQPSDSHSSAQVAEKRSCAVQGFKEFHEKIKVTVRHDGSRLVSHQIFISARYFYSANCKSTIYSCAAKKQSSLTHHAHFDWTVLQQMEGVGWWSRHTGTAPCPGRQPDCGVSPDLWCKAQKVQRQDFKQLPCGSFIIMLISQPTQCRGPALFNHCCSTQFAI